MNETKEYLIKWISKKNFQVQISHEIVDCIGVKKTKDVNLLVFSTNIQKSLQDLQKSPATASTQSLQITHYLDPRSLSSESAICRI